METELEHSTRERLDTLNTLHVRLVETGMRLIHGGPGYYLWREEQWYGPLPDLAGVAWAIEHLKGD